MPQPRPASGFRLSLCGLLFLFVGAAVACAGLKYANHWWASAFVGAATLSFMAAAIIAAVDRGPSQAFAIGFAACVATYVGMLVVSNWLSPYYPDFDDEAFTLPGELDPFGGLLPTTKVLGASFKSIVTHWTQDPRTGERRLYSNPLVQFRYFDPSDDSFIETPERLSFMVVGHSVWTLALGMIGGRFAQAIYWRRSRKELDNPSVAE